MPRARRHHHHISRSQSDKIDASQGAVQEPSDDEKVASLDDTILPDMRDQGTDLSDIRQHFKNSVELPDFEAEFIQQNDLAISDIEIDIVDPVTWVAAEPEERALDDPLPKISKPDFVEMPVEPPSRLDERLDEGGLSDFKVQPVDALALGEVFNKVAQQGVEIAVDIDTPVLLNVQQGEAVDKDAEIEVVSEVEVEIEEVDAIVWRDDLVAQEGGKDVWEPQDNVGRKPSTFIGQFSDDLNLKVSENLYLNAAAFDNRRYVGSDALEFSAPMIDDVQYIQKNGITPHDRVFKSYSALGHIDAFGGVEGVSTLKNRNKLGRIGNDLLADYSGEVTRRKALYNGAYEEHGYKVRASLGVSSGVSTRFDYHKGHYDNGSERHLSGRLEVTSTKLEAFAGYERKWNTLNETGWKYSASAGVRMKNARNMEGYEAHVQDLERQAREERMAENDGIDPLETDNKEQYLQDIEDQKALEEEARGGNVLTKRYDALSDKYFGKWDVQASSEEARKHFNAMARDEYVGSVGFKAEYANGWMREHDVSLKAKVNVNVDLAPDQRFDGEDLTGADFKLSVRKDRAEVSLKGSLDGGVRLGGRLNF